MSKGSKIYFGLLTVVSGLFTVFMLIVLPVFGEGSLLQGDRTAVFLDYYFAFDELIPEGILMFVGFVIFALTFLRGLGRGPQFSRDWGSLRAVALTYSCILILFFAAGILLNIKNTTGFLTNALASLSGQSEEKSDFELQADSTLDFPALPFVEQPQDPYALTLHDMEGKEVPLSAFKGKAIYMNFWATWCPPCRAEMPNMENLWESVKENENIAFVAISNEDAETVKKVIGEQKYTFPVYVSPEELPPYYEIGGIPTTMIFSPDGKRVFKHTGSAAWDGGTTKKFLEALAKGEAFSKPEVEEKAPSK